MKKWRFSRRHVLQGTAALAGASVFASPLRAQAPAATAIDQKLIDAAKKEGKVVWYTAVDLPVAEKVGKAFEAKYPGIAVRIERSGAERVFQRIGQEYASNIHAVDVANSSDAAHFIVWKRDGLTCPKMWPSITRPSTRTRMACSPATAPGAASSASTPIW